jgi:hypothetical protein
VNNLVRILLPVFFLTFYFDAAAQKKNGKNRSYFEIKVYHFANAEAEKSLDSFFQHVMIPHLHRNKVRHVGVFKAMDNDTAADKRVYIFLPFRSLKAWNKYTEAQAKDNPALEGAGTYVNASNSKPAYTRMEIIFLKAFAGTPEVHPSKLTSPKKERVYELRSYESASEKLHANKVHMFDEGGEVDIFDRLGFNAVFYGSVIHGAKMPNLMYMTSFENMKSRGEHWGAFGNDPAWKVLSAKPQYQDNITKIDIIFLRATEYSDL